MNWLAVVGSLFVIALILVDAFDTMVLPRRVTYRLRFSRLFYSNSWLVWRAMGRRMNRGPFREAFLARFGPLSLLTLFAAWALGLIVAFAVLNWGACTTLSISSDRPTLDVYLYLSGVTFFTLGYGDVTPGSSAGRFVFVAEAGVGFGFLAIVIGYMPVLYQAFSRREVTIGLMDARAGSPPSALQLLHRLSLSGDTSIGAPFLQEWEQWSAELLESHLSFPVLSFYRSQHDNQSWLATITTILDVCAVLIAGSKGTRRYRAQLTFAMARHAVVDFALLVHIPPKAPDRDRLDAEHLHLLRASAPEIGLDPDDAEALAKLAELRQMYEPFVSSLADFFLLTLPSIVPDDEIPDNWQRTAWTKPSFGFANMPMPDDNRI